MDYSTIETAVHDTLKADSWLGNLANIKTFEKGRRFYSLHEREIFQFFKYDELPAIGVRIELQSKRQRPETTEKLIETVNVEVQAVSKVVWKDVDSGEETHRTIVKNIERALDGQKTSDNNLGLTALCGYVNNTLTREVFTKDGDSFVFHTTTICEIETTVTVI